MGTGVGREDLVSSHTLVQSGDSSRSHTPPLPTTSIAEQTLATPLPHPQLSPWKLHLPPDVLHTLASTSLMRSCS